mgnify:CR=1 FL=1
MNTATQFFNAQSTSADPSAPAAALLMPVPVLNSQDGGLPSEAQPFDAELQALLDPLPTQGAVDTTPMTPASSADAFIADAEMDGQQSLEQAEALLGLLGAQHHQQVQAQPLTNNNSSRGTTPDEVFVQLNVAAQPAPSPSAAQVQAQTRLDGAVQAVATAPEILALQEALTLSAPARPAAEAPASMSVPSNAASPAAAGQVDRLLRLEGNDVQRGEQMLQALRNNVQFQLQNKQQIATIRLDPPELGSLEIQVNQDAGRISIQISAAQADTLRLLQLTSDRLRHELLTQQFVQVNVQVGGEGHSGQQSRQNQGGSGEARVQGNPLTDGGLVSQHTAPPDVLATA